MVKTPNGYELRFDTETGKFGVYYDDAPYLLFLPATEKQAQKLSNELTLYISTLRKPFEAYRDELAQAFFDDDYHALNYEEQEKIDIYVTKTWEAKKNG